MKKNKETVDSSYKNRNNSQSSIQFVDNRSSAKKHLKTISELNSTSGHRSTLLSNGLRSNELPVQGKFSGELIGQDSGKILNALLARYSVSAMKKFQILEYISKLETSETLYATMDAITVEIASKFSLQKLSNSVQEVVDTTVVEADLVEDIPVTKIAKIATDVRDLTESTNLQNPAQTADSSHSSASDHQQIELPIAKAPAVKKKGKKSHKTVAEGAKQMIINYVWLGSRTLGPLERFNVNAWASLGHIVNIYTHPFSGGSPHTFDTLGIAEGTANVIPLTTILTADDEEIGTDNPKAILSDGRSILKRWLSEIPETDAPSIEHIYNMVDLTKSYIGGTRQGIVLDLKVGPSVHLQDYAESFDTSLISYTRAGNTAGGLPENQSIGTMQETEELRIGYATEFNKRVSALSEADVTKPWFNQLTGYHGQSYEQVAKWLDVATKTPTGELSTTKGFDVSEPGGWGHGPFRVFKSASDQTNKSTGKTKPEDVFRLAEESIGELEGAGAEATQVGAAKTAKNSLPREKLW